MTTIAAPSAPAAAPVTAVAAAVPEAAKATDGEATTAKGRSFDQHLRRAVGDDDGSTRDVAPATPASGSAPAPAATSGDATDASDAGDGDPAPAEPAASPLDAVVMAMAARAAVAVPAVPAPAVPAPVAPFAAPSLAPAALADADPERLDAVTATTDSQSSPSPLVAPTVAPSTPAPAAPAAPAAAAPTPTPATPAPVAAAPTPTPEYVGVVTTPTNSHLGSDDAEAPADPSADAGDALPAPTGPAVRTPAPANATRQQLDVVTTASLSPAADEVTVVPAERGLARPTTSVPAKDGAAPTPFADLAPTSGATTRHAGPEAAAVDVPVLATPRHEPAPTPLRLPGLSMDLGDEGLGPLRLQARTDAGGLHLTLTAGDRDAAALLSSQSAGLRRELESSSAQQVSLDIGHGDASGDRSGGRARDRQPTADANGRDRAFVTPAGIGTPSLSVRRAAVDPSAALDLMI